MFYDISRYNLENLSSLKINMVSPAFQTSYPHKKHHQHLFWGTCLKTTMYAKKDRLLNPICHEEWGSALCPRQILLFVEGASGILKNFIKVFGLQKFYFKYFLFKGGSAPFVRIFSEIWKIVFIYLSDQSQQKLNLQIIYRLFCFKYNNGWLRIHKLLKCKQFQIIFGKQVLLYI